MTAKLPHPPTDCISRVRFSTTPGTAYLLVTSWDAHVRLYDAGSGQLSGLHQQSKALLDGAFMQDYSRCLSGGLDGTLVAFDFQGQQEISIGRHDAPIRCIEYHAPTQQVFTGSWDRTLRSWDWRQPGGPNQVVNLGTKAFALDTLSDKVVLGGADRHIHIFDVRRLSGPPLERRESSLKHQIRALKVGTDQRGFASSSVEGRVAIEYFGAEENHQSHYAFKCHRVKEADGSETVHPVNALAYHPVHGTFATGGSDGGVCVWDGYAKKRLWRLNPFEAGIASLCFSADGGLLAIGISSTADHGEKEAVPPPALTIRHITDSEVRPKGK